MKHKKPIFIVSACIRNIGVELPWTIQEFTDEKLVVNLCFFRNKAEMEAGGIYLWSYYKK